MFDLLKLITNNSASLTRDVEAWFEKYRADAAWNIYSDYCVGNKSKANNSFSFVLTLKHDTDKNFSEYIANLAPKDLKKTAKLRRGLSPTSTARWRSAFRSSLNDSKLLRDFITDDNIHGFCLGLRELVASWSDQPRADKEYWRRIDTALG